jgi:hypothetical protein
MPIRTFIRNNLTSVAIFLFFIVFAIMHQIKPSFLYNINGTLRDFGLGYEKKTILPAWLITFVLAILSYLAVLYYLAAPKISY